MAWLQWTNLGGRRKLYGLPRTHRWICRERSISSSTFGSRRTCSLKYFWLVRNPIWIMCNFQKNCWYILFWNFRFYLKLSFSLNRCYGQRRPGLGIFSQVQRQWTKWIASLEWNAWTFPPTSHGLFQTSSSLEWNWRRELWWWD